MIDVAKSPRGSFDAAVATAAAGDEIIYHVGEFAGGAHRREALSWWRKHPARANRNRVARIGTSCALTEAVEPEHGNDIDRRTLLEIYCWPPAHRSR